MEKFTCCFCGKLCRGWGNSTWGCWSPMEEENGAGEKNRCCDECNMKVVIPARIEKMEEITKL